MERSASHEEEDLSNGIDWPTRILDARARTIEQVTKLKGEEVSLDGCSRNLRVESTLARHLLFAAFAHREHGADYMPKDLVWPMGDLDWPAAIETAVGPVLVTSIEDCEQIPKLRNSPESLHMIIKGKSLSTRPSVSTDSITEALELLASADDSDMVALELGAIVLGKKRTRIGDGIGGYTSSALPGTVFTDWTDRVVFFAEYFVHECAHSYFNECLGTIEGSFPSEPWIYSVWRRTMRPPFGIAHAVFAFSHVAMTLRNLLESGQVPKKEILGTRLRYEETIESLQAGRESLSQLSELEIPREVRDLLGQAYADATAI